MKMKYLFISLSLILISVVIIFSNCIKINKKNIDSDFNRRQNLYKTNIFNYIRACNLEKHWYNNKNIKTKNDLEKIILKYSIVKSINPNDSMWGYNYKLKENEKMIQYLLFKTEPLDVVYDKYNTIIAIYTSYE
jgi:hypothetical protein